MNNLPGPPRFVPTLTDIVQSAMPGIDKPVEPRSETVLTGNESGLFEEQLMKRVMQRVDLTLDRRLREALGQVILAQTQNLVPLLRQEIELVVRESVSQALAQEPL